MTGTCYHILRPSSEGGLNNFITPKLVGSPHAMRPFMLPPDQFKMFGDLLHRPDVLWMCDTYAPSIPQSRGR